MTSNIDYVGASSRAMPAPVATAGNAASSASASNAVLVGSLENPRVVLDPMAGFITEYLSGDGGQVVSQSPSAITVAYLRQGLTPDGSSKHAEAPSVATTA
ncbi:MAG: hypothetical protein P4M13_04170 [Alphaproteobacteria bacterium]|nr:hypothetical protein [Alphaproteobacteria bacterium]